MMKAILIGLISLHVSSVMAVTEFPATAACTVFNVKKDGVVTEFFSKEISFDLVTEGPTLIGEMQGTEFNLNIAPTIGPVLFQLTYSNAKSEGLLAFDGLINECRKTIYGTFTKRDGGFIGVRCEVSVENCNL